MSRSLKKGPFVINSLLKKIDKVNSSSSFEFSIYFIFLSIMFPYKSSKKFFSTFKELNRLSFLSLLY